jgi:hypothetical protein
MGHFDQFPTISSRVGYLFGQKTVAATNPDGRADSRHRRDLLR